MVDSIMMPVDSASNCELDTDQFLLDLHSISENQQSCAASSSISPEEVSSENVSSASTASQVSESVAGTETPQISFEHDYSISLFADNLPLHLQESNIVAYIGGYIVRKLESKLLCQSCIQLMTISPLEATDQKYMLINLKQNPALPVADSLRVPSPALLEELLKAEHAFAECIGKVLHMGKLYQRLLSVLKSKDVLVQDVYKHCNSGDLIRKLYTTIRLHFYIRLANDYLRNLPNRRNRKLLKVQNL